MFMINWDAVSSIATFTAVLVALYPIFANVKRQGEVAKTLRFNILTQLTILRPIVARRFTDTGLGQKKSTSFTDIELKPISTLEVFFSQAHILNKTEHDVLGVIILNLSCMLQTPIIDPATASQMLTLIDEAIKLYTKSDFIRGKNVITLWDKN